MCKRIDRWDRWDTRLPSTKEQETVIALFHKSGAKTKSDFVRDRLLDNSFKIITEDKSTVEYYRKLSNITALIQKIGILYNQTVKAINSYQSRLHRSCFKPAYDALMMFKILLLQTWYGLSDYEVEERISDSLLFSEFLLLDMGLPAPDHSTICRFRAELTRLGIMDKLLRELNKQFKKHGISRIDQGAIVDASIVDSPHAPDGSILIEVADDREDLRTEEEQAQEQAYQYELKSRKPGVDTEARWVRKGRHYRYGYKKHVLTDGQGLLESVITTPANCADTVVLPELIEKAELTQGVSVLADKGYCSKKNSACLLERGLIDGIMLKVQKGMKLTERQRELNNAISKIRCLIERTFGSIRRWFSGGRCRYRGLERTHTQNILEAMAYNLKRMPGLLVLQSPK